MTEENPGTVPPQSFPQWWTPSLEGATEEDDEEVPTVAPQ